MRNRPPGRVGSELGTRIRAPYESGLASAIIVGWIGNEMCPSFGHSTGEFI